MHTGEISDVVVERVGDRIHLYSAPPWEVPGLLDKIKSIPGANWKKTDKCWTYPLSMDVCRSLRRKFDDLLVVGPELAAWSAAAAAEEAARVRLAHLKTVQLKLVPEFAPELYAAMRRYQRVGAKYLAQENSILADQPGLGKTVQLLASLIEGDRLPGLHLIAAPVTSLEVVWVQQVLRWLGMEATHVTGGAERRKRIIAEFFADVDEYGAEEFAHFLIVNPEMLAVKEIRDKRTDEVIDLECKYPELLDQQWTTFTVDEAQRYILGIKNAKRMTQTGRGIMSVKAEHKVALTGTPFKGRPKNAWGLLHFLHPERYRSYWQWVETYFTVTDNGFGKEISDEPADEMREAFYRQLDTVMLRRTKSEVLKDLPPKEYNDIWVDMTPAQKKQYDDMVTSGEAKFGDRHISVTGVLAELTRCSQIATAAQAIGADGKPRPTSESGKFNRLMEELEKRGINTDPNECWGTNKFVVASQFTEVLLFLEEWFGLNCIPTLRIDGSLSAGQRAQAQRLFQAEGGARIMLIQTHTAQAIDLDAWCDEMFVIDETFVPDDQEQLEDRIHRASRIHQVTIHYLRTRDTIDENRKALVDEKENIQKLILDGRRGVEFAKKLMGRK